MFTRWWPLHLNGRRSVNCWSINIKQILQCWACLWVCCYDNQASFSLAVSMVVKLAGGLDFMISIANYVKNTFYYDIIYNVTLPLWKFSDFSSRQTASICWHANVHSFVTFTSSYHNICSGRLCDAFTHFLQGSFTGREGITSFSQCQWNNSYRERVKCKLNTTMMKRKHEM